MSKQTEIINIAEGKPLLTVALPIYRCKDIIWLVMEALCRQKNIDFDWEILSIEEQDGQVGIGTLSAYADRLKAIGCKRFVHWSIDKWMPLSKKWYNIAHVMSQTSLCFLLQGADDFPQPYRLKETCDIFQSGSPDWVRTPLGLFYDIASGAVALLERNGCGRDMAIRAELIKKLPFRDKARSVDHWIYYSLQAAKKSSLKVFINKTSRWTEGFCTAGLNNISRERSELIRKHKGPFLSYSKEQFLKDIPKDIVAKIERCKNLTVGHKYMKR